MAPTPQTRLAFGRILAGSTAAECESQTLEFKNVRDLTRETINVVVEACLCLANAAGGEVILGIANKVAGTQAFIGTAIEPEQLKRRIFELTRPSLLVDISEERQAQVRLLAIRVPQSPEIHSDMQGRTNAQQLSSIVQKTAEEAEQVLRRLASENVAVIEPVRQTARQRHPNYRLRAEALKALGSAVPYQRRTVDEIDRKVIAHVREYGKVTNRTLQNLFDMSIQRARGVLADMVGRRLLRKTSAHERGPGVEYGPGSKFPSRADRATSKGSKKQLPLDLRNARSRVRKK